MAYGASTIIVYGSIFEKPRTWIKSKSLFFGEMIGCIMCSATWVGFFMSICLGGLATRVFEIHWLPSIFFDGIFTTGIVWTINTIVEHFE
jgi:hypothetical protein